MIPKKLLEEIIRWMREKKYGNIQINFSNGKIVNINRVESIRLEVIGNMEPSSVDLHDSL